jgi:hypothetical protein
MRSSMRRDAHPFPRCSSPTRNASAQSCIESGMDNKLTASWVALRYGIGLTATLAGLDKFFNILTDWTAYVSPIAAGLLPVSVGTFMGIVGVIEVAVGAMILIGWARVGGYIAAAWLVGVAVNLVFAGFFDIAVRDVVMAIAAFTLARLAEVRGEAVSPASNSLVDRSGTTVWT